MHERLPLPRRGRRCRKGHASPARADNRHISEGREDGGGGGCWRGLHRRAYRANRAPRLSRLPLSDIHATSRPSRQTSGRREGRRGRRRNPCRYEGPTWRDALQERGRILRRRGAARQCRAWAPRACLWQRPHCQPCGACPHASLPGTALAACGRRRARSRGQGAPIFGRSRGRSNSLLGAGPNSGGGLARVADRLQEPLRLHAVRSPVRLPLAARSLPAACRAGIDHGCAHCGGMWLHQCVRFPLSSGLRRTAVANVAQDEKLILRMVGAGALLLRFWAAEPAQTWQLLL